MRESVVPCDGFVDLHVQTHQAAHDSRRVLDLPGIDICEAFVIIFAHFQAHHDLFERGVARPLAYAVDRTLDFFRAVLNGDQRVCGRKPGIVMAMHA
jgi:hypothetical protein